MRNERSRDGHFTRLLVNRMNRIHTTVVIPSLHSPWIGQIVEALHRQQYDMVGVEVLVVGLDKHGLVQEDGLVRFVSTGIPVPPATARNVGICYARGDIICFLDADCLPEPDWLSHLTAPYASNSNNVVGGVIRFPLDYWTVSDTIAHFPNVIAGAPAQRLTHLPTLNFSARRAVFGEIGLFDERFRRPAGEDTEITKRMLRRGYALHVAEDAVVYHLARRRGPMDLWKRAYLLGNAAGVPSLSRLLQEESSLFEPGALLVTAAPRALAVTARTFAQTPGLRQHWRTFPMVFSMKLVWAVSAAIALYRAR